MHLLPTPNRPSGRALVAVTLLPIVYGPQAVIASLNGPDGDVLTAPDWTLPAPEQLPEEVDTAFQSLWQWGCGSEVDPDDALLLLEPAGDDEWTLRGVHRAHDEGVELCLMTFTPDQWLSIGSDVTVTLEPETAEPLQIETTASVVSGVLTSAAGDVQAVASLVLETIVFAQAVPETPVVNRQFHPLELTVGLPEATAMAQEIATWSAPETGATAGGHRTPPPGQLIPCPDSVPYEELTCECRCAVDQQRALDDCLFIYDLSRVACLINNHLFVSLCVFGCTPLFLITSFPGWLTCMTACIGWTLKTTMSCLYGAVSDLIRCIGDTRTALRDCLHNCSMETP